MTLGKRAVERAHVAAFLASIELEATIEASPDGEGPDFIVHQTGARFGVEHTRVYRVPEPGHLPRRQLEGVRDQVLRHAELVWRQQSGVPVEVHCHFDLRHLPDKPSIPEAAERLVRFVRANLPPEGKHSFVERQWHEPQLLPRAVSALSIYRASKLVEAHWVAPDADMVPDLEPALVQSRIDAKAAKYTRYAAAVPEVWLLMVLEGHRLSGMFGLEGPVTEHCYRSPFARNYLFEAFSREPRLLRHEPGFADPAA